MGRQDEHGASRSAGQPLNAGGLTTFSLKHHDKGSVGPQMGSDRTVLYVCVSLYSAVFMLWLLRTTWFKCVHTARLLWSSLQSAHADTSLH